MRRQNVERRRQRSRCCWTLVLYAILYHNIMMRYALDWKGMVWCGIFGPSAAGPYGQEYGTVCCGMMWLWYGVAECCWTLTPTHPKTLLPNPTPTRAAAPQTLFLNISLLLMCIISHLGIGQAFYWESLEILVQNISLQNLTRFSFWRLL